ncbi:MAG: M28 family peptidase [Candidatus Lokiarchaeota archaeon]|nr:M28 family peptidase [Candidatus Lokiarchaeota archaeon]
MNIKVILVFLLFSSLLLVRVEADERENYTEIINQINNNIDESNLYDIVNKLCENNSRITGTLNCNYSAYYIKNKLGEINLSRVYFQSYNYNNTNALNINAHLRYIKPERPKILIMAHYDSISTDNLAPGANDNAASVAAIIEMMRIIKIITNNSSIERNLLLLSTSGEEQGLYGSRAWINKNSEIMKSLIAVINFDMISWGSYHTIIGNQESWLTNFILESSEMISIPISKSYVNYPSTAKSDHSNFMNLKPTVWIFERDDYYSHMHRASDTIDKVNFTMLCHSVRLFSFMLFRLISEQNNVSIVNYQIILLIITIITIPIVLYLYIRCRKKDIN